MRDSATTFPSDAVPTDTTALRVWFCKYQDLGAIASVTSLRVLVVAGYPNATLEPIASLGALEYLSLVHLPKVTDLGPLESLSSLRVLRLQTLPSWDSSGKVTEVSSLAPLAKLGDLRHLELFGVRPTSRSLAELEACPSLESVRVSKYPNAEVLRFRAATEVSDAFAPGPGVADWH